VNGEGVIARERGGALGKCDEEKTAQSTQKPQPCLSNLVAIMEFWELSGGNSHIMGLIAYLDKRY
jgi:hypothetical protein